MPLKDEHLAKAEHNEKLGRTLAEKTQYHDWAATVLFYSALHYVHAVLAVSGEHPDRHAKTQTAIGRNGTLKPVFKEYLALEILSRNARYYAMPVKAEHIQRVMPEYEALRARIRRHLGIKD